MCVKYVESPSHNGDSMQLRHGKYIQLTPPCGLMVDQQHEFGEIKVSDVLSLSLCEEICQLKLRRHILKSHHLIMHMDLMKEAYKPICLVSSCFIGSRTMIMAPMLSDK